MVNHVNEYEFIKWIKSGGYGKVFLGKHVITGELVAIKKIDVHDFSSEDLYNISRESVYLESFKHKNIIKCLNSYVYDNNFFNVMEHAAGGELNSYLANKGPLPEPDAKRIFMQFHDAVKYIHSKNVIHRDLKPNNILFLDVECTQVVLIDFGISGISNGNNKETVKAGTTRFMPPEMISGLKYESSPKLDVWALGVILYLMVFGQYPFDAQKESDIVNKIIRETLKFPNNILLTKVCYTLLQGMLEKNQAFRMDINDQLFEDWFKDNSPSIENVSLVNPLEGAMANNNNNLMNNNASPRKVKKVSLSSHTMKSTYESKKNTSNIISKFSNGEISSDSNKKIKKDFYLSKSPEQKLRVSFPKQTTIISENNNNITPQNNENPPKYTKSSSLVIPHKQSFKK